MREKSDSMGAPVDEKALEGVTGGGLDHVFPTGNEIAGKCPCCNTLIYGIQMVNGWTTSCRRCGQKIVYANGTLFRAD